MLSFIIGYVVLINIISMLFMYIDMKTDLIKIEEKTKKFIYIILSIIGGSIGILVTSQMFGYRRDEKIIKRVIPFIIFIEVIIIGYLFIKEYDVELLN